jgi:hypothetical protein
MIEIDAQGLTAVEFEEILCDVCRNSPFSYYCPACDFKACSDCMHKAFRRLRSGSLRCKRCGHADTQLYTFIGPDKV